MDNVNQYLKLPHAPQALMCRLTHPHQLHFADMQVLLVWKSSRRRGVHLWPPAWAPWTPACSPPAWPGTRRSGTLQAQSRTLGHLSSRRLSVGADWLMMGPHSLSPGSWSLRISRNMVKLSTRVTLKELRSPHLSGRAKLTMSARMSRMLGSSSVMKGFCSRIFKIT